LVTCHKHFGRNFGELTEACQDRPNSKVFPRLQLAWLNISILARFLIDDCWSFWITDSPGRGWWSAHGAARRRV
jgi:hypothetical protein